MEILSAILDRGTRKPTKVPVEAYPLGDGLWAHRSAFYELSEFDPDLDFWVVSDISGYALMQGFETLDDAKRATAEFLEAVPYWNRIAPAIRAENPVFYPRCFFLKAIVLGILDEFLPDEDELGGVA